MSDREARRRGAAGDPRPDTNPLLDALRLTRIRLDTWRSGEHKPRAGTIQGSSNALDEAVRAPRLSDEQLEWLVDLLRTREPNCPIADMLESSPLLWLGGEQAGGSGNDHGFRHCTACRPGDPCLPCHYESQDEWGV